MLQTEHGLSILLQTERPKILLDTGASDVFQLISARKGIKTFVLFGRFLALQASPYVAEWVFKNNKSKSAFI